MQHRLQQPSTSFVALLVTLAILAAACGSDSADREGPALEDPALVELHERWFRGWLGGGEDMTDADWREFWREREQALVECMAGQGVEYTPRPYGGSSALHEALYGEQEGLAGTREYAERYGYGMVTTLVENEISMHYSQQNPSVDPNEARLRGTDVERRLAYLEAMYGPPTDETRREVVAAEFAPSEYTSTDYSAGCEAQVVDVTGSIQLPDEAIQDRDGIIDRLAAAPEVIDAQGRWAACMQDAGFSFGSRNDIDSYLSGQVTSIGEQTVTVEVPGEGTMQFTVSRPDPDELAAAVDRETAVAVADYDCDEHSGLSDAEADARYREELRWVDRWSDRLTSGD